MRTHVILAVFKRNVASYFSGVLGYLFIVVFVVAGAFLAFNPEFFANNLCNLDQLSNQFPLLLLFIVPAITMTAWADERKLGTDELLFTLPARDYEILIGKYLAVLAVYTVALLFSLTHAFVLSWLGNPDWGLIATTYLGYWLAGAALLAGGMFASVLTSSATIAFVLGAAICAIPVFIDQIPGLQNFKENVLNIREPLSVGGHLAGFTSGKIQYSGLFYFLGLTAFFLYLNAVFIARRHWAGGKNAAGMSGQYAVRVVSLGVALLALTYAFSVAGGSIDQTSERLHTLSRTTIDTLKAIPDDKPITIQAFISPDVPQEYVTVREELVSKLREYDKQAGKNLQVRIIDVEPFSSAAEQADGLGLEPRNVRTEEGGRLALEDIYLGVVMSSGFDSVTIPFFDRGTPVEYELTRSVGTVSQAERKVVGVLVTDAKLMGGLDMQTFRSQPEWRIVTELKKQYTVKEVSPDAAITAEMDVLLAVLPSSLTPPQMENFVAYVQSGKPVLIFDDPVPRFGPPGLQGAPLEPKPSQGGGGPFGGGPPPEPKADGGRATSLSEALDIRWDVEKSQFDLFCPHPKYAEVFPKELIFLTDGDEGNCLNPLQPITSGLQEVLTFYPGVIEQAAQSRSRVTRLLESRAESSGTNLWDDVTQPGFFGGRQFNPSPPYKRDPDKHMIAALLEQDQQGDAGLKAIFVADIDLVHDVMFDVWQQELYDLKVDNVLFVLNCVDFLSGDERFIDLRKRRAQHRTLTELEEKKRDFEELRSDEIRKAEDEAKKAVDEAKENLEKVVADVQKEMEQGKADAMSIQARLQNATEAENRRLAQKEREIEREKNDRIRRVRIDTQQEIRKIENGVWRRAVAIPPLPAIILGVLVILGKLFTERKGIASDRLR